MFQDSDHYLYKVNDPVTFLLLSGVGCGLWLWHSPGFTVVVFFMTQPKEPGCFRIFCINQTSLRYLFISFAYWRKVTKMNSEPLLINLAVEGGGCYYVFHKFSGNQHCVESNLQEYIPFPV